MMTYQETAFVRIPMEHVNLMVKREDLNHPLISGNKWWKLKYNLQAAIAQGHSTILTFGGAYSNHLYATAAAAKEVGLRSIGIVRGEKTFPLNPTLAFAESCGMVLHYLSREQYRIKTSPTVINHLLEQFGAFMMIPEGGTNALAIKGCIEWGQKLREEVKADFVCLPVGTGGTIAGVAEGLSPSTKVIGFPVLRGASFLEREIASFTKTKNITLMYDYHFGGYAKKNKKLITFIHAMMEQYGLPLDHVYTGKMFYGVLDLIHNNYFKEDATVVVLHTGGLQGSPFHLAKNQNISE